MYKGFLFFMIVVGFLSCNSARKVTEPNSITESQKKEGWQLLFDGKSTNGWHTFNKSTIGSAWKAEDNSLHLDASKKGDWQTTNGGDIIFEKEYKNFDLKIEWKISVAGNSGIIFYAQEGPQYGYAWETGIECQVADNEKNEDGKIIKHRAGELYDLLAWTKDPVKPAGEWNQVEIICNNGNLKVRVNDQEIFALSIRDDNWKKLIAASKFKVMPGFGMFRSGKISLQDHGADVWYRNIMIKEL